MLDTRERERDNIVNADETDSGTMSLGSILLICLSALCQMQPHRFGCLQTFLRKRHPTTTSIKTDTLLSSSAHRSLTSLDRTGQVMERRDGRERAARLESG